MSRFKSLANVAGLLVALLLLFAFFSWRMPQTFPTFANLQNVTRQSVITVMVSLGLTFVIVAGGIDLSVGSVAAFSCVAIAAVLKAGGSPVVAALAGIGAGAVAGLINGGLITAVRVVPFIVTLGTLSLFRGAAKGFSNSQNIYPPSSWLNSILEMPEKGSWLLFPVGVWLTLLLAIVMGLVLRFTRFGRHVVAIGSNENAARLCGVPISRVKLAVYVIGGVFAGLAGLMFYGRENVGDPTAAVGLELNGIAAVVIGGASLSGGQGTILGSVLGALLMTTWQSGAGQMDLKDWIQEMVTGAVIVFAVSLDRFRKSSG
jgi:ribose/xylose/arabinose/galactoside ABC-type transport system permease subunit